MHHQSAAGGRSLAALAVLLGLVAAACSAAPTPSPTVVNVELKEWAVIPSTTSAPAGRVTFTATNTGPEDKHELVIIKTDLPAFELPTDANGKVDEEGAGIGFIGEIEEFDVGATESLTFDLTSGSYVLFCNIYDEAEKEAHYKEGMLVTFTVP